MEEQQKGKKKERPGKDFYKTPAEIAAIKAANQVTQKIAQTTTSIPTWNQVKGDWKVSEKESIL
jgi:hypothetical protein